MGSTKINLWKWHDHYLDVMRRKQRKWKSRQSLGIKLRTPLAWATSALPLSHDSWQPPTLTILYMYCTGGTECLSCTPGSHSACAIRTLLGFDRKILSIRKEPMPCASTSVLFTSGCWHCTLAIPFYYLCLYLLIKYTRTFKGNCDRLSINHPFTANINNTVRATISPT